MGAEPYEFRRDGRSLTTVLVVVGVWLSCLSAYLFLDAAPWLLALPLACTLPAVWDVYAGTHATLTLDDEMLRWSSGRQTGDCPLARVDHVRLDTRLDFSIRASAVLHSGEKIRLPQDATPPADQLEAELTKRNIKSERHHFSLLG